MSNTTLFSTFVVGALLASVALNVALYRGQAQPSPGSRPPAPYEELDLTPAQIRILNKCGQDCADAVEALRQESALVTEELQVALSEPEMDDARVKALAEELCRLRNQEVDNNIATLLEVRTVLEPHQLRTLYRAFYPDWVR